MCKTVKTFDIFANNDEFVSNVASVMCCESYHVTDWMTDGRRAELVEPKRNAERRRRQRIKEDPVLKEQQQHKQRDRYLKRKAEKKVISVKDMSGHQKRAQRKKWKEQKRRSRMNQAKLKRAEKALRENSPSSEEGDLLDPPEVSSLENRSAVYKQIRAANRKQRSRKVADLKEKLGKLQGSLKMYQMRLKRLRDKKRRMRNER